MKPSDRALLLRVAVGMAAPPVLGAVLVAIAGWPFSDQAKAMLAASSLAGGGLVGGIQLWDRRREADIEVQIPGLNDLQIGISTLTENLADLRPPALPPAPQPHPEAPTISVAGYTVPPTAPLEMATPRSRVDQPDPNSSSLISEADLTDTPDLWADNGQNSSYSSGFHA